MTGITSDPRGREMHPPNPRGDDWDSLGVHGRDWHSRKQHGSECDLPRSFKDESGRPPNIHGDERGPSSDSPAYMVVSGAPDLHWHQLDLDNYTGTRGT